VLVILPVAFPGRERYSPQRHPAGRWRMSEKLIKKCTARCIRALRAGKVVERVKSASAKGRFRICFVECVSMSYVWNIRDSNLALALTASIYLPPVTWSGTVFGHILYSKGFSSRSLLYAIRKDHSGQPEDTEQLPTVLLYGSRSHPASCHSSFCNY
jgi:hypothetical protein